MKQQVKEILDRYVLWYYMPVQGGYGVSGIPDFIVCVCGHFLAIETKAGKNKQKPMQVRQQLLIRQDGGGICEVVTENGIADLEFYLRHLGAVPRANTNNAA